MQWIKWGLLWACIITSQALSGQIDGQVLDRATNKPIEGVLIIGEGENAVSDKEGFFSIDASNSINLIHLAYETQLVLVDTTPVTVWLSRKAIEIDEVVVSSPFLGRSLLSTPTAVSKLQTKDWIASSGFTALSAIQAVSGVQVQSGALNTHRITIRGMGTRSPFSTNRVRAFFDGIPLTGGDGETEIDDIDLSLLQSVEVIKGGKSALYGAGLGGAILLNPLQVFRRGLHGQIGIEAGAAQLIRPRLNLTHSTSRHQTFVHFSTVQTDGWRKNSEYNRNNFMIWHKQRIGEARLSFLLQKRDVLAHIPSSLNEEDFINNPSRAAPNWAAVNGFEDNNKWLGAIKLRRPIGKHWISESHVFYQHYQGYESRPFNILDDEHQRLGAKTTLERSKNSVRMRLGAELLLEQYQWRTFETLQGVQGPLLNHYEELRRPVHVFAQFRYQLPQKWILETGLSGNWLQYTVENIRLNEDRESHGFPFFLSPFIGLNKSFGEKTHLYANLGNGFSYPSLQETLLPEGFKNNELRAERANYLDLGLRSYLLGQQLFLDVAFYGIWGNNLLHFSQLPNGDSFGSNGGETRHLGVEAQVQAILYKSNSKWPSIRLNLGATFGQYKYTRFFDQNNVYTDKHLPVAPNVLSTSQLNFQSTQHWHCRLQHQYVSKQWLNNDNSAAYGDYHLLHLDAGYDWKMKNYRELGFTITIRNLTNIRYAPMLVPNAPSFGGNAPRYYYPGQGINGRMGITYRF
jgi:iron complex outermembrane receptor protein